MSSSRLSKRTKTTFNGLGITEERITVSCRQLKTERTRLQKNKWRHIMGRFTIYVLHQILLEWSYYGEWDGWSVVHVLGRSEMHTIFWLDNLKGDLTLKRTWMKWISVTKRRDYWWQKILTEDNCITCRLNSGNACYHSVQNLLSSRLLSKNIKIRIYKTIILPVVLYCCETWSLT
jgi:hypothetical protein